MIPRGPATLRKEGSLAESQSWAEPKSTLRETLRVCLLESLALSSKLVDSVTWILPASPQPPSGILSLGNPPSPSRSYLVCLSSGKDLTQMQPGCWAPVGVGMGWRSVCSAIMGKRYKKEYERKKEKLELWPLLWF